MSHAKRHQEFLSLMESFLKKNLGAAKFCSEFTSLWVNNRDETYAKKAVWAQPYDELLVAEWQRGEIGANEFEQKWARLWGYEDDIEFQKMIDALHSSCYVFRPFPEQQGEINEEELRQEVKEALAGVAVGETAA